MFKIVEIYLVQLSCGGYSHLADSSSSSLVALKICLSSSSSMFKSLRYRGVAVDGFMSIGHTGVSCYLHFEQLCLFIMTFFGCKRRLFCEG